MAALDDCLSRCQGQSWTLWAQRVGLNLTCENEADETESKHEGDSMKLRKEDMTLFGFCPARDEFYLVVCEVCRQVVKPQALQKHIELRHSGSQSVNTMTTRKDLQQTCETDQLLRRDLPEQQCSARHNSPLVMRTVEMSGPSVPSQCMPVSHASTSSSSCASCRKPNASPFHQQQSGASSSGGGQCKSDGIGDSLPSPSSSKKNHSLNTPVVRVERIPPCGVSKGATNSTVGSMGAAVFVSPAVVPLDKRELPSPQQPPPTTSLSVSPSTSSSPVQVSSMHNQLTTTSTSSVATCGLAGVANFLYPLSTTASSVVRCSSHVAVNNRMIPLVQPPSEKPKPSSKAKSKVPQERKLLPCKDRVYDPDKHCGVFIAEIGKQCTRSLTCKTHSLANRRNVSGRRKNFDELLAEHRAAKEAQIRATKGAATTLAPSADSLQTTISNVSGLSCTNGTVLRTGPNSLRSLGTSSKTSNGSLRVNHVSSGCDHLGSNSGVFHQKTVSLSPAASVSHSLTAKTKPLHAKTVCSSSTSLPRLSPSFSVHDVSPKYSSDVHQLLAGSNSPDSKGDFGYISRHPRPAAVCTFNARQMGSGFYVYNRALDNIRAVLRTTLVERTPPSLPVKKLCVESRLPPVPEPTDPSDPYCFLVGEQHAVPSSSDDFFPKGHAISPSSSSATFTVGSSKLAAQPSSAKTGGKTASRNKTRHNRVCVLSTNSVDDCGGIASDAAATCRTPTSTTNSSARTPDGVCVASVPVSLSSQLQGSGVAGGGGLPAKRKRLLPSKSSCKVSNPAQLYQQQNEVLSRPATTATASLIPVSFSMSLTTHLATTVPHLGAAAKSGSLKPLIVPACTNTSTTLRTHAAAAPLLSPSKDDNLVMTNVEMVNGQFAHGVSPCIARTSCGTYVQPTSTSAVCGSITSIGGLQAAAAATVASGTNRASLDYVTPVVSSFPATTTTTNSSHVRPIAAKRARSTSKTPKFHSVTTVPPVIAPADSKWTMVNSTAVLTGLGALSNAGLLRGTLSTKNHMLSANATITSIAHQSSPRSNNSRLVTSSSNQNGVCVMPNVPIHHKGLDNHILSSNAVSFTLSPGNHSTCPVTSSVLLSPNSDGHVESRENNATKT